MILKIDIHLCSTLFLFTIASAVRKVYNLSEQSPSFAIHGDRLAQLKSILITVPEPGDFLLDFSQIDCNQLWAINDTVVSDQKENKIVLCWDPIPFLINGQPVQLLLTEVRSILTDITLNKMIFIGSSELKAEKSLLVESFHVETPLEYGISFRFRKWVNGTQKVLVVPQTRITEKENNGYYGQYFVVESGMIATLVQGQGNVRPSTCDRDGPQISFEIVDSEKFHITDASLCPPNIMVDVTCQGDDIYTAYYGSDPGLARNPKYQMIDLIGKERVRARQTAVSVFTDNECSFCLNVWFGANCDYLNGPVVFNSLGYPWEFEDSPVSNQVSYDAFAFTYPIVKDDFITVTIVSLEGGKLWFENIPLGDEQHSRFRYSYDRPTEFELFTYGTMTTWKPNATNGGYTVYTRPSSHINPANLTCHKVVTLTEEEPQFVTHIGLIARMYGDESTTEALCIRHYPKCNTTIDLTVHCEYTSLKGCLLKSPIEINGVYPDLKDCKQSPLPKNDSILVICRFFAQGDVYLRALQLIYGGSSTHETGYDSAISVMNNEWIDDSQDLLLFPNLPSKAVQIDFQVNSSTSYRNVPNDKWKWIIFSLANYFQKSFFSKMRWDHPTRECEYQLFAGPPNWRNRHPERLITVFKDLDAFTEMTLESNLYSLLVPPECTPSILVRSQYDGKAPTPWYMNVCGGTSTITSWGHRNPFELTIDHCVDLHNCTLSLNFLINAYQQCLYPLDITVEFVSYAESNWGGLSFLNSDGSERARYDLLPDTKTLNKTEKAINGIAFDWYTTSNNPYDGCLLRVTFTRHLRPPVLTNPTTTPANASYFYLKSH